MVKQPIGDMAQQYNDAFGYNIDHDDLEEYSQYFAILENESKTK